MNVPLFSINPELISVHIPKTAGSSFHAILKAHYGWQLKHIQKQEDIACWSNGKPYKSNKPFVKAVHGHIRPHENWKTFYPLAKWVCWLRDPAERVVSAYYHLQKTQQLGDKNQRLFAQKQPTLQQFIGDSDFFPVTRIYKRFLGNFTPNDFGFIGRTEYFEEDLLRFFALINATPLASQKTNVGHNKQLPEAELLGELKSLLQEEYSIYATFLKAFYP